MRIDTGLRAPSYPCQREGCRDKYTEIIAGATRRERLADAKQKRAARLAAGTALCLRHSEPDKIPTLDNPLVSTTLVIVPDPCSHRGEVYAVPADDLDGRPIRFAAGPGFRFFPEELPAGARVTFSVTVEAPGE